VWRRSSRRDRKRCVGHRLYRDTRTPAEHTHHVRGLIRPLSQKVEGIVSISSIPSKRRCALIAVIAVLRDGAISGRRTSRLNVDPGAECCSALCDGSFSAVLRTEWNGCAADTARSSSMAEFRTPNTSSHVREWPWLRFLARSVLTNAPAALLRRSSSGGVEFRKIHFARF